MPVQVRFRTADFQRFDSDRLTFLVTCRVDSDFASESYEGAARKHPFPGLCLYWCAQLHLSDWLSSLRRNDCADVIMLARHHHARSVFLERLQTYVDAHGVSLLQCSYSLHLVEVLPRWQLMSNCLHILVQIMKGCKVSLEDRLVCWSPGKPGADWINSL